MRILKTFTATLLSLILALGLMACPAIAQAPTFTAGTYTVDVTAHNGPATIGVTFSESAITDIQVLEHCESLALGTVGMDKVAADILASQSLDVDMVSGATVSAAAMRYAVEQAVKAAGADPNALRVPTQENVTAPEDVHCDVVIVGSGTAGMSAAAEAADLGLHAILVEQLGLLGGSSMRTGYVIGGDTRLQKEQGIEYTTQDMIAQMTKGDDGAGNQELYNHDAAVMYATMFGENIDWLQDIGIQFGVIQSNNQFRGPNAARLGSYLISGLQT